jgi:5,10-methylenetetrahydrofolate reductase
LPCLRLHTQATFLVEADSDATKKAVLANLANPDNTARFYSNAAAYTLNILNGPEVAPQVRCVDRSM